MADHLRDEGRRLASMVALVFSAMLHAVVAVFVFPSGLIAPGWAWLMLVALWMLGAWLLWRWRRFPIRILSVPFVMAAIWWVTITAGDVWLGWTA